MRLGDLDALKKQVKELLDLAVKRVNDTPNNSPCYRMYVEQENERARLIDLINNAPTVIWCSKTSEGLPLMDMRERPQGEWKLDDTEQFCYCDQCEDTYYPRPLDPSWNYCPHCGADMRGKEE